MTALGSGATHVGPTRVCTTDARETLEKCGAELLADGAALFNELCMAITVVETQAAVDVLKLADGAKSELSRSHRINTTGSALFVLLWVEGHVAEIPTEAIGSVAGLVEIGFPFLKGFPKLGKPVAEMLFGCARGLQKQNRKTPSERARDSVPRNTTSTIAPTPRSATTLGRRST